MDQFQTLSLLNLSMIQNGIFTVATFFILWVAFRMASQVRGDQGTLLAKILTTAFGLFVIALGLQVFANRNYSLASAAKALTALKTGGQALGVQAEAFLASPYGAAPAELQYSLFSNTSSVAWWALVTVIFVGVVWLPVKK
jgi:hypothetical protein